MPISNLNLASGSPIKNALARLKSLYSGTNCWVPLTNKYIYDTIENVRMDLDSGGSINDQDMVDYIASSAVVHCFNSWSYLTTAVNSFLEGDYGSAVHNAYYSELRSLMSFLATQGVGVFLNKHIIIDSSGVAHKAQISGIKPGTHIFAKAAFEQWLRESGNTARLLQSIKVRNYPLETWLNAAGFTSLLAGMTSAQLINNWSIDINLLSEEHDLRNFVSYRPQNFNFGITRQSDDLRKRLETVLSIWDVCEPSRFFELIVLRKTLDELSFNQTRTKFSDEDEAKVKQLLVDMGMDPSGTDKYIVDFLKRRVKNTDNILLQYATTFTISNPIIEKDTEPAGILSRACLLLLTITNIIEDLLKASSTTKVELAQWHSNLGVKLGYWEHGDDPMLFSDLWLDVEDEINEINKWLGKQGPTPSVYAFKTGLKQHTSNIRHINRSFFWQTHSV